MSITAIPSTPVDPTDPVAPGELQVHRSGAGEPLVLLHGLGESSVGWRPVMAALAVEYDVIAIDLPGFGGSPALPWTVLPTAANLADAVTATLDQLGIDEYHVAGYSLGARVAIQLAESSRVRSVVAIAPDGLGTPLERVLGFVALVAGSGGQRHRRTAAGRSVFFAGSRSLPWQLAPADARELLTGYAGAPAYESTNWASMFDWPTRLDSITAPTLLLQGTADPLMTQQISRYQLLIPGARLVWLAGLNHVPISDAPDTVARLILTHLREVAPRALVAA